jgi:hypothetical protein
MVETFVARITYIIIIIIIILQGRRRLWTQNFDAKTYVALILIELLLFKLCFIIFILLL